MATMTTTETQPKP